MLCAHTNHAAPPLISLLSLRCSVVLWELLTWELPWGATNPWQVVTIVSEGGRLQLPEREKLPGPDSQVGLVLAVGLGVWLESRVVCDLVV